MHPGNFYSPSRPIRAACFHAADHHTQPRAPTVGAHREHVGGVAAAPEMIDDGLLVPDPATDGREIGVREHEDSHDHSALDGEALAASAADDDDASTSAR